MEATPKRRGGALEPETPSSNAPPFASPVPFRTPANYNGNPELSMNDLSHTPVPNEIDAHSEAQLGIAWEMYGNSSPRTASPQRRAVGFGVDNEDALKSPFANASPRRIVDRIRAINPNFKYVDATPNPSDQSFQDPLTPLSSFKSPFIASPFIDAGQSPFGMDVNTPGLLRTSRRLQQYFAGNPGATKDSPAGVASPQTSLSPAPAVDLSRTFDSAPMDQSRPTHSTEKPQADQEISGGGEVAPEAQSDVRGKPQHAQTPVLSRHGVTAAEEELLERLQRSVGKVKSTPQSTALAQRLVINQLVANIDKLATSSGRKQPSIPETRATHPPKTPMQHQNTVDAQAPAGAPRANPELSQNFTPISPHASTIHDLSSNKPAFSLSNRLNSNSAHSASPSPPQSATRVMHSLLESAYLPSVSMSHVATGTRTLEQSTVPQYQKFPLIPWESSISALHQEPAVAQQSTETTQSPPLRTPHSHLRKETRTSASGISKVDLWVQAATRQLLLKVTHVANSTKNDGPRDFDLFPRLTRYVRRMRLLLRLDHSTDRLENFQQSRYFEDGGVYDLLLVGLQALIYTSLPLFAKKLCKSMATTSAPREATSHRTPPAMLSTNELVGDVGVGSKPFWRHLGWFCACASEILALIRNLRNHHLVGCLGPTLWTDYVACANDLRRLALQTLAGKPITAPGTFRAQLSPRQRDQVIDEDHDGGNSLFFAASSRFFETDHVSSGNAESQDAHSALLCLLFEISPLHAYGTLRHSVRNFGWLPQEAVTMTSLVQGSAYAAELLLIPALFAEITNGIGAWSNQRESRCSATSGASASISSSEYRGSALLALGSLLQRLNRIFERSGPEEQRLFSEARIQALLNILLYPSQMAEGNLHLSALTCRRDQILAAWVLSKCGPAGTAALARIAITACRHASSPRSSRRRRSTTARRVSLDETSSMFEQDSWTNTSSFFTSTPSGAGDMESTDRSVLKRSVQSWAKRVRSLPPITASLQKWINEQPVPPASTRMLACWALCQSVLPVYSIPFQIDRQSTQEQLRVGLRGRGTDQCADGVHGRNGILDLSLLATQPPATVGTVSSSAMLLGVHAGEDAAGEDAASLASDTRHPDAQQHLSTDGAALLSVSAVGSPASSTTVEQHNSPQVGAGFGASIGVGGRSISLQHQRSSYSSRPRTEDAPHFFLTTCKPDLFQEVARGRCSIALLRRLVNEVHPLKSESKPTLSKQAQSGFGGPKGCLKLAEFCVVNSTSVQTISALNAGESHALAEASAAVSIGRNESDDEWLFKQGSHYVKLVFSSPALVSRLHAWRTEAEVLHEARAPLQSEGVTSEISSKSLFDYSSVVGLESSLSTPAKDNVQPASQHSFASDAAIDSLKQTVWQLQEDVCLHIILHDVSQDAALAALSQLATLPARYLSHRTLQALKCIGALEIVPRFCRGPSGAEMAAASIATSSTATSASGGRYGRGKAAFEHGGIGTHTSSSEARRDTKKMQAELRAEVFRALANPLLSSRLFSDQSFLRFLIRCLKSPYYKVRIATACLLKFYTVAEHHSDGTSDSQLLPALVTSMLDKSLPADIALQTIACVPGGAEVIVGLVRALAVKSSPTLLLSHALHFAQSGRPNSTHRAAPRHGGSWDTDDTSQWRRQQAVAIRKRVNFLCSGQSFAAALFDSITALPSWVIEQATPRNELLASLRGLISRPASPRNMQNSSSNPSQHTGRRVSRTLKSKKSPVGTTPRAARTRTLAIRSYGFLVRRIVQSAAPGKQRVPGSAKTKVDPFDIRTALSFLDRVIRECAARRAHAGNAILAAEAARQIAHFGEAGELLLVSTLLSSDNVLEDRHDASFEALNVQMAATVQMSVLPGLVLLPPSSSAIVFLLRLAAATSTAYRLRLRLRLEATSSPESSSGQPRRSLEQKLAAVLRLCAALSVALSNALLPPNGQSRVDVTALLAAARRYWLLGGGRGPFSGALSDAASTLAGSQGIVQIIEHYHLLQTNPNSNAEVDVAQRLLPVLEFLLQEMRLRLRRAQS